jgi:uncharacterized repeat protein (TIGR01451 family)
VVKTEQLTAVAASGYTLSNSPFNVTMVFGPLATGCNPPPPPPPGTTSPDLGITKVGPSTAVKPGDNVSYTLTVTNTGNGAASNVVITDTLPAALTFVSSTGGCTGTTTITCTIGNLAVGGTATITVVTKLAADYASTAVANVAVVGPPDSNPGNNTDTEVTQVTLPTPAVPSDLGLSKVGTGTVAPGGVISWVMTVTNIAGTPAAGFTVTDTLPGGLTLLTVGGTDWSCTKSTSSATCTYTGAPLPVGGTAAFGLDALVSAGYPGTTVSNTAVVDPGGVDTTNDSATASTDVVTPITGGTDGEENAPPDEVTGGTDPQPVNRPALPFTGSYADRALSAGVMLLLVGLALTLIGRRRRSA